MTETTSPYWWVDSGGYLKIFDTFGHTNEGDLPLTDKWRVLYAANNPVDTDGGAHPQNIFRLLTRSQWQNDREEAYFRIDKDNLSASPNRNQSNGLLLFDRYLDHNNLYYAGIRVDGAAVIKKKQNGTYYTLTYASGVYPGTYSANGASPDLIPKNQWIGLRLETTNNADGSVYLALYMDKGRTGTWQLVAQATDRTGTGMGTPITAPGYGGIRTDFMDVSFDNFRVTTP